MHIAKLCPGQPAHMLFQSTTARGDRAKPDDNLILKTGNLAGSRAPPAMGFNHRVTAPDCF